MPIANAGTPLIWAGFLWLVLGNLLIGKLEAWFLGKILRCEVRADRIIIGNYVSAGAGIALLQVLDPLRKWVDFDPIGRALPFILGAWIVVFILTVLVELPFVRWAVERKLSPVSGLKTSLGAQAASYALLLPLALVTGQQSALRLRLDPNLTTSAEGWVYYASPDDREVWRVRLDGSRGNRDQDIPYPVASFRGRIMVEPLPDWDRSRLVLRSSNGSSTLSMGIGHRDQSAKIARFHGGFANLGNVTFGPGSFVSFRSSESPGYVGFWAWEGLRVGTHAYALETPLLSYQWRCGNELPDGKVVIAYGPKIILLDPSTGHARYLAEGFGPSVLLD